MCPETGEVPLGVPHHPRLRQHHRPHLPRPGRWRGRDTRTHDQQQGGGAETGGAVQVSASGAQILGSNKVSYIKIYYYSFKL